MSLLLERLFPKRPTFEHRPWSIYRAHEYQESHCKAELMLKHEDQPPEVAANEFRRAQAVNFEVQHVNQCITHYSEAAAFTFVAGCRVPFAISNGRIPIFSFIATVVGGAATVYTQSEAYRWGQLLKKTRDPTNPEYLGTLQKPRIQMVIKNKGGIVWTEAVPILKNATTVPLLTSLL